MNDLAGIQSQTTGKPIRLYVSTRVEITYLPTNN